MTIYTRRITFDFFTVNTNLTVVFEPIDEPTDEFTFKAFVYENNKMMKSVKVGGNVNKTKALNLLKLR